MPDGAGPGDLIISAMAASGMSLDDLSRSTRLRVGLLEQMTRNDFVITGGDVYARGHLRVIAGVLGLDVDELLFAYDALPVSQRPPAP